MADIREWSIGLLSSTAVVDMQTAQTNSLFTVPAGKVAVITHVVVRNPTDSLLGGSDYDLGVAAAVTSFLENFSLITVTDPTHYFVVENNNVVCTIADETEVFSIKVITGSTAAANATIDVFGYLYDA